LGCLYGCPGLTKSGEMIDRREKIERIKEIMAGKVIKPLIEFIHLRTWEGSPGIYVDEKGKRYSESEKAELIKAAEGRCEIPWVEVRTYEGQIAV
jgi:hypothetical protein